MNIQNNILRLLQTAKENNVIYTSEITELDKLLIAMMYSLPPVANKELKKILSYLANSSTILASIKRLEKFSYLYHISKKGDDYYTYSYATTRILNEKGAKSVRPVITNIDTNKLKSSLLLFQVQTALKNKILKQWQSNEQKEEMLSKLYIKFGPFSRFLSSDKEARRKTLGLIMPESRYEELLNTKTYIQQNFEVFIEAYKEMKLSKDDGFIKFKNSIETLVEEKSNDIVDVLIDLLDFESIKQIFTNGILGEWCVSREQNHYTYNVMIKNCWYSKEQYETKKKLATYMYNYDLNRDNIISLNNKLSRMSKLPRENEIKTTRDTIELFQQKNKRLKEVVKISTLSILEANNIFLYQYSKDSIEFFFLNTRSTMIPRNEFKQKVTLCTDFATTFSKNAKIVIFCNTKKEALAINKQIVRLHFDTFVSTQVKPDVKLKNEVTKNLTNGGN